MGTLVYKKMPMFGFIVLNLMLSVLAAKWAAERGRDFWTIFFISIAITPLAVIGSLWTPFKNKRSSLLKE
jgi:uncharacterized membrane protein YqjE